MYKMTESFDFSEINEKQKQKYLMSIFISLTEKKKNFNLCTHNTKYRQSPQNCPQTRNYR